MSGRFGQNLKGLRQRAGLTQAQLATRLGYERASTISYWEHGRGNVPSLPTIAKLAQALRCPAAELVVGLANPYDTLRGVQDLPGPPLLLSAAEEQRTRAIRKLNPERLALLDSVLLPALMALHHARRRATRPPLETKKKPRPRRR